MAKALTSEAGKFPVSVPIVIFFEGIITFIHNTISICCHPFCTVSINEHSSKLLSSLASSIFSVENAATVHWFSKLLTRFHSAIRHPEVSVLSNAAHLFGYQYNWDLQMLMILSRY
jgi:hypothetical protein